MPELVIVCKDAAYGPSTEIQNIQDVAKRLRCPPEYIMQWFSCRGYPNSFTRDADLCLLTATLMGHHDVGTLGAVLDEFMEVYVLCPVCKLAQTKLHVKDDEVFLVCYAGSSPCERPCGAQSKLDRRTHEMYDFILEFPPDADPCLSSSGPKMILTLSLARESQNENRYAFIGMDGETKAELAIANETKVRDVLARLSDELDISSKRLRLVSAEGLRLRNSYVLGGNLTERVVCIGDVHGHAETLKRLWEKLGEKLGKEVLEAATVVFLGDLCDRGPNTREVLDFVSELVRTRAPSKTKVLAGNHDLGMAAFLGCLPADVLPDDLDATKCPKYESGFWPHRVDGGMHYQGRRWGGSDSYNAEETFESYSVPWISDEDETKRAALCDAVPKEHKELLQSMSLVHDCKVSWPPGRVVCVHAGLRTNEPAEAQIDALKARDLTAPQLFPNHTELSRLDALSGRDEVLDMHPDLKGQALLVSGHHGFFDDSDPDGRIICDMSGGRVSKITPLQAVILPERRVISSSKPDPGLNKLRKNDNTSSSNKLK